MKDRDYLEKRYLFRVDWMLYDLNEKYCLKHGVHFEYRIYKLEKEYHYKPSEYLLEIGYVIRYKDISTIVQVIDINLLANMNDNIKRTKERLISITEDILNMEGTKNE